MKKRTESEVLHRMAAMCSSKECCIQDIRIKAKSGGLTEDESQRIIDRLCQEKFIDESRYVKAFVKDKLRFSKWGRIKISFELHRKGIPSSLIEEELRNIDETTYKNTLKEILIQKRKSTKGETPREISLKLFRFAAGRGFESPFISSCLKEILNVNTDENFME